MSATDDLCRMLDERGVEWWQSANTLGCVFTRWYSPIFGDEVVAMENGEEGLVLFDHYLTPEQAIAATLGAGTCRNASKVMDEHGWVRLPLDADGVPIHVGDVMEWVRYEDDDPTIVRKVSAVGSDVFFAWSDEQGRYAQYEAHAYRHHHVPTVEDVLREFALAVCKDEALTIRKGVVEEFAKRLTLAEEVDDG